MTVADRFSVAGRTALVTGSSRGIGKAMARGLVEAGADVAILSRSKEDLDAALAEILAGSGRRGITIAADLSRRGEAQRAAQQVLAELGRVDILVSNAGEDVPQTVGEITDEAWDCTQDVHVSAAMALTRALAPQMMERRWGRLIYTSSLLGFRGYPGRTAYSAAKGALVAMVRSLAVDVGPRGVTANCIAPGPFTTDLSDRNLSKEAKQEFSNRTALLRWAEPDEIIGPLLMLASGAGDYITGTTLMVDGGCLAK
jgi:NAD(P)-dependent dehydrogenase (short-subunit alcohol dehydrogenase family)